MMNEIPSHWCRLPDAISKDIVKTTFSGSSNGTSAASDSVPARLFSLLGLLDPQFSWLKRWFISTHARAMIVSEIRMASFLEDITSTLLFALDTAHIEDLGRLQTISCVWSLHVLGQLVSYNNGRALFPLVTRIQYSAISESWIRGCLQGNRVLENGGKRLKFHRQSRRPGRAQYFGVCTTPITSLLAK